MPAEFLVLTHTIEYSIGRYQIRINFWFLIIFLLTQTLLNELGFWQLNRAKEKQHRITQLIKGNETVLTDLSLINNEQIAQFQSVELELELLDAPILLLDNKINNQRPGYHVLNLVRDTQSGKNLLVNRGWVFAGLDRNQLPKIDSPKYQWKIKGRVYPLSTETISTAQAKIEESKGYYRLPVLDLLIKKQLQALFKLPIEDYVLRLDAEDESAFDTNWVWTNMPPEKHLAYAFQWFALAFAFLIISIVTSIKKR